MVHTDDLHVDQFAQVMKDKLALARERGRGGWDDPMQCTKEHLVDLIIEQFDKGDPVDIANFCMMLYQRGVRKF